MKNKIVLILGGGGIIGQHMLLSKPDSYNCIITRTVSTEKWWTEFNSDKDNILEFLDNIKPDFIVNLSGENRVDIVEQKPEFFYHINVKVPEMITSWCASKNVYYIQCSTQGVFSGNNAEYSPQDVPHPITHYGRQRLLAENAALSIDNSEVARLTFVLGVRPYQNIGRRNPLEDIFEKDHQLQVNDRFFSPLFAHDAAKILWERITKTFHSEKIYHLGNPIRCSRFTIAQDVMYNLDGQINNKIEPVSHEHFVGFAPRPYDTTWKVGKSFYRSSYQDGLIYSYWQWRKIKNEY